MEKDLDQLIKDARAERAAAMGKLIGNGIYWLMTKTANIWDAIGKFADSLAQDTSTQIRDAYFARSSNLAELEQRQREWEQDRQYRY